MKPAWTKDNNGNTYIRFPNWHEILCILKDGGAGYGRTPDEARAWARFARAHEETQLSPFTVGAIHELPLHELPLHESPLPSNFKIHPSNLEERHALSDL